MSNSTQNVTRTVWASLTQSCKFAGIPLTIYPNSTINERLNILANAPLAEGEMPDFGWWSIGDGGHKLGIGDDGKGTFIDPLKHGRLDTNLFNPIPFAMKRDGNDLPPERRKDFIHRRIEEHDGITYFCYYGKPIKGIKKARAKVEITTVINGEEVVNNLELDSSALYPVPKEVPPDAGIVTDRRVATVTIPITIEFTEQEVEDLLEVARILYKSEKRAIISEIACITGVSRETTVTGNGNEKFKFNEVVHAQPAAFISTYQQMTFNRLGFTMELEIGSTEPLETGDELPMEVDQYRELNVLNAKFSPRR